MDDVRTKRLLLKHHSSVIFKSDLLASDECPEHFHKKRYVTTKVTATKADGFSFVVPGRLRKILQVSRAENLCIRRCVPFSVFLEL